LEVFKDNLVDLYINGDSVLRSQNHGIQLSEIGQNTKLHVTGLNEENKLFIIEAQIIQTNSNSGISSGNNNGNGNTTTNSASNQQESSQQNIQSSNNTSQNSQKGENPGNGNSEATPNNEKSNNGRGQGNVKGVSTNYFDYLLQNIKYFFNFN
jgi:hypothetical protein